MEGCYSPAKLKRKDLGHDFSLSSPATKIRRLDAELPPISEEEEIANPMVFGDDTLGVTSPIPITIDELTGSSPVVNEERAIVLYDPMNNIPLLQTRSPFSVSVHSDFLSGFKNPVVWSNCSSLLQSINGKTEKHRNNSEENNGSLAVVPWVPTHTQHVAMPEVDVPHTEMMDADDMEATTMDMEDNNSQQILSNDFGVNQWQQHCMLPGNLSTPITWSGV